MRGHPWLLAFGLRRWAPNRERPDRSVTEDGLTRKAMAVLSAALLAATGMVGMAAVHDLSDPATRIPVPQDALGYPSREADLG